MIVNLRHLFNKEYQDYRKPYKIETVFNNNYVKYMSSGSDSL